MCGFPTGFATSLLEVSFERVKLSNAPGSNESIQLFDYNDVVDPPLCRAPNTHTMSTPLCAIMFASMVPMLSILFLILKLRLFLLLLG
jgi:hypothetical protein